MSLRIDEWHRGCRKLIAGDGPCLWSLQLLQVALIFTEICYNSLRIVNILNCWKYYHPRKYNQSLKFLTCFQQKLTMTIFTKFYTLTRLPQHSFRTQKFWYQCTNFLNLVLVTSTFAKNRWYQEPTHNYFSFKLNFPDLELKGRSYSIPLAGTLCYQEYPPLPVEHG